MKAKEKVAHEVRAAETERKLKDVSARYRAALREIAALRSENDARGQLSSRVIRPIRVRPVGRNFSSSEATAFLCASDWHVEEEVRPEQVNGLNRYNLDLAGRRAEQFFQKGMRIINIFKKDIRIPTVVLWLGGDFISSNIHEDTMESALLRPIQAIMFAQRLIHGGIVHLLEHHRGKIIVVCNAGNHTRITRKLRIANETGNALETMMYSELAQRFAGEGRVKFMLNEGYFQYLDVYGRTLRFHHGTYVKYLGGVGDIFPSLIRSIYQWNLSQRADLDVIGHWHRTRDAGICLVNGSLIGYNAFSISIKSPYERPKQNLFLLDKRRGRTINAPIIPDV